MLASKLNSTIFNLLHTSIPKINQPANKILRNFHLSLVNWNRATFPRKYHPSGHHFNLPQPQQVVPQTLLKGQEAKKSPGKIKPFLLTTQERQEFLGTFPNILRDLANLEGYEVMTETKHWANQVVEYNVPQGKHFRSAMLIKMAKEIQSNSQDGRQLPNLNQIGWTFEMIHACSLIMDDMMDGSKTRRNEPCWYLRYDLGMAAINDGLLCESMTYALLKKYAKGKYPMYEDMLDLCHDVTLRTVHGQSLDLWVSRNKQYSMFTEDTYYKLNAFKNAYYTFYFPIACALLLNGINDNVIFKSIEKASVDIGIFFSMQDDYLDCYADPKVSGKIGTDIQDGKCSWLVVNALKKANSHQRKILLDNYGQTCSDKIAKVKSLYNGLGIPEMYSQAQEKAFENLDESIAMLPPIIPKEPLENIVKVMFKRSS